MDSEDAGQGRLEVSPVNAPLEQGDHGVAAAFRAKDLFTAPWAVYGKARRAWWVALVVAVVVTGPLTFVAEFSAGVTGEPAYVILDAAVSVLLVMLMASFAAALTGAAYDGQRLTPVGMFRGLAGCVRQIAILSAMMLGLNAAMTVATLVILGDQLDVLAAGLTDNLLTLNHSDLISVALVSVAHIVLNFVATYLAAYAITLVINRGMTTLHALRVSIGQIVHHPVKTILVYTGIVVLWGIILAFLLTPVIMIVAVGSIAAGDMNATGATPLVPLAIVLMLALVGGTWISLVTNAMASIQALRLNTAERDIESAPTQIT